MSISSALQEVKNSLPQQVCLVAVSKTKPNELLIEAYNAGQRIFGENKVQELVAKQEALPKDIEWHMIGHLQSNKVKYIAPFVQLIHGVDSLKLLKEINKQGKKFDRTINVLLQFFIASEITKFGFSKAEAEELLQSDIYESFGNIKVCGVMGMASNTDNESQVKNEFQNLKRIFDQLQTCFFPSDSHFEHISMGMSNDFELAINCGSTMVRVGSKIFGNRS